jgi:Bacterial HORMA domain 2
MSTAVQVNTAAHAATHVATNLVRSVRALVKGCGLDTTRLVGQWEVLEAGVSSWLASKHLRALTLEVFDPNRKAGADLVGRFDFTIDYGYDADGDGDLWFDPDAVAYAIRKNGAIPARCDYRLVADNAPGRPDVPGWSSTSYRSTADFTRHTIGSTTGGGSLGVNLAYYSRRNA